MKFKQLCTSLLIVTYACSCVSGDKKGKTLIKPVFTATDMDLETDPGSNFYDYANGGWCRQNPLPDDKSRFGTFDMLAEDNKVKVRQIVEKAAAEEAGAGTVSQLIGDFFKAGMNEEVINAAGYEPVQPYLDQIAAISDKDELVKTLATLYKDGLSGVFYFYSTADAKNSTMTIAGIYQGGLGLPVRDYYLDETGEAQNIRTEYMAFIQKLFTMTGKDEKESNNMAKRVLAFETTLAQASNSMLENRNPNFTYNKMGIEGLEKMCSPFPVRDYIEALGVAIPAEINVSQPRFMTAVGKSYADSNLDAWKEYLKASVLRQAAPYLSKDFSDANFVFYGQTLSGKKEQEPRWKKVIDTTNGALGEAVGQLFVAEYFPPVAKERMDKLVGNLRIAFGQRLDQLEWMSDSTKKAAHGKLDAITVKIGYPDKWRDYSDLVVKPANYLENIVASNRFDFEYDVAKIGKPVDKKEWGMTPQTVNAYYNPKNNEIVFPAAILQPPFFYLDGDDAVNYGAIGVVIGHEMTHGFDDQGRLFDKDGNLKEWWTAHDSEKFKQRTAVLVDQFNNFEVLPGVFANGELSLGENIADLGGLVISYQAYLNALNGKEISEKIDGFSDKQRFYLAYARVWAQNIRDKEIARLTKIDVHSLGNNRINGPLPHVQEWYDAFGITPESPMFIRPEERASIW